MSERPESERKAQPEHTSAMVCLLVNGRSYAAPGRWQGDVRLVISSRMEFLLGTGELYAWIKALGRAFGHRRLVGKFVCHGSLSIDSTTASARAVRKPRHACIPTNRAMRTSQ